MNDAATNTDAPPAPAATKRPKTSTTVRGTTIWVDANDVSYDVSTLSAETISKLAVMAARRLLVDAKEAGQMWAALLAGDVPGRKTAAPKELDPWRLAVAMADADAVVKDLRGAEKKAAYDLAQDNAKQKVAGYDRATMARERRRVSVMIHHAKLTGTAE